MLQNFLDFIKLENIFNTNDKILLGVSGGIDSVVMVDLFARTGFDFGIAHCNFGLRSDESEEDQSFVELLAQKYNVPYYTKIFETNAYAKDHSISIQMAARELRVEWFEEIILNHGFSFYATAHHLDDQIETILNNFFRGTGISGLHGILPKQGNLIHPMLFCLRKQIEEYANQQKLKFRVDSSNRKAEYTRNKIRHQLIPQIKDIYPSYQKTITDNIQRFKQIENIYREQIQNKTGDLIITKDKYIHISIEKLRSLKSSETYLYEIIKPFGFNYTNAVEIINSFYSSSGKLFLSSTHKITKDRTELIIEKRGNNKNREYTIEKDSTNHVQPIKLKFQSQDITPDFNFSKDRNIANLDAAKLKFPLVLRKWENGDYFFPLGMNQKKLLSDFFIDNKISIPDKEQTWLLVSDGQIAWVIGQRIDNRFKITGNTKTTLTIDYLQQTS